MLARSFACIDPPVGTIAALSCRTDFDFPPFSISCPRSGSSPLPPLPPKNEAIGRCCFRCLDLTFELPLTSSARLCAVVPSFSSLPDNGHVNTQLFAIFPVLESKITPSPSSLAFFVLTAGAASPHSPLNPPRRRSLATTRCQGISQVGKGFLLMAPPTALAHPPICAATALIMFCTVRAPFCV